MIAALYARKSIGDSDRNEDARSTTRVSFTTLVTWSNKAPRAPGPPERNETMAWKIVARKVHRLRCPECERMYTEDEARQLWECSREDCQETFVDDDRECPCCGSPLSRRLADFGCEDCLEALEEIHDKKDGTGTDDSHQREGVR